MSENHVKTRVIIKQFSKWSRKTNNIETEEKKVIIAACYDIAVISVTVCV